MKKLQLNVQNSIKTVFKHISRYILKTIKLFKKWYIKNAIQNKKISYNSETLKSIIRQPFRYKIPHLTRHHSLIRWYNIRLKSSSSELIPLLLISLMNLLLLPSDILERLSLLLQYSSFKLILLKLLFPPHNFNILSPILRVDSHPGDHFCLDDIFLRLKRSVMNF